MSSSDRQGNGSKRGRTETSPLPSRPNTPGEAELGDWMKEIQDQINQLKRWCEMLESENGVLRAGTDAQNGIVSMKISQITGRLDKIQDKEKRAEDQVHAEIEEVLNTKVKMNKIEETYEKIAKQVTDVPNFSRQQRRTLQIGTKL